MVNQNPNYGHIRPEWGTWPPPEPSDVWMRRPAWIDGARNPPLMYRSHEHMNAVWNYWRPRFDHVFENQRPQESSDAPPSASPASSPPPQPQPNEQLSNVQSVSTPMSSSVASSHYRNVAAAAATNPDIEYAVRVTKVFQARESKPAASRFGKQVPPKLVSKSETLMGNTVIHGLNRTDFIQWCLAVHGLHSDYAPGVHSGPTFLFGWSGMGGGIKNGRISIDTDSQFMTALTNLAKCNARKANFYVSAEFDLETMDGYRIRKRAAEESPTGDDEPELTYGTKVPRVENAAPRAVAEAFIIEQLEKRWNCNDAGHCSTSGVNGLCYVDPATSQHIGINNRVKGEWAKLVIQGKGTVEEPPNMEGIDVSRDGVRIGARARGRTGPRPADNRAQQPVATVDGQAATTAMLVASIVPLIKTISDQASSSSRRRRHHTPSPPSSAPSSPTKSDDVAPSAEKLDAQLRDCLDKFHTKSGCDLGSAFGALRDAGFTVDIIPAVPVARLIEVTGGKEGEVMRLQKFCTEYEKKMHHRR
ncbi:hypothetical protein VKT23_007477 [Stygiomarasmius scandens]|uniref:Uncharacterized protein n=1 Tax=Marasmiellus scandens TaxID=2682957 RepID=A0ABR1JK02_9AGAR